MTTALTGTATAGGSGGDAFRSRLLDGLSTAIDDKGYRDSTVADIVRHARTSKRTFYDQFASKEACFIELLRANNAALVEHIRSAVSPEAEWQDQIDQAVGAYVEHIESAPSITLSWIRELPALGPAARPLQRDAMGGAHRSAHRPQRQSGIPARRAQRAQQADGHHPAGRSTGTHGTDRRGRPRHPGDLRTGRRGVAGDPHREFS